MTKDADIFRNLRGEAPGELLDFLARILSFFPDDFRFRVRRVLEALPPEGENLDRVLELIKSQWKDIQSQKWVRIAVVGPSHTGKETLLHSITGSEAPVVEPIFSLVEIPGLDEYLGYSSGLSTPRELRDKDILLLVLDGRYGVSESTVRMANLLRGLGKPMLVVLNKIDLVEKPREALKDARKRLGLNVLGVSAVSQESVHRMFGAVASTYSGALYPLTQSFPGFRSRICNGVVTQAAVASSLVGGLRIPVSDLLPLTAIQTGMLLKVARAFGHELGWRRARELGPMLLSGLLVRMGAHELSRQFPGHRMLLNVTVAGTWTFALGRLAVAYFERFANLLAAPASSAWEDSTGEPFVLED